VCGIVGKVGHDRDRPADPEAIAAMVDALRHRGPDDRGVWTEGPAGLGHARLSILDLSERAHEPMPNEDGSLWIVFNGEIYDFREHRRELAAKGHVFRSDCDAEVALHLYEEIGAETPARLRGMFAFAIWDARRRVLFAARDRLGKKPLYYRHDREGFAFASEPKALLRDPAAPPASADPAAIWSYLTLGYVPGEECAFAGMRKLPPAHSLVVAGGRVELARYWQPRHLPQRRMRLDAAAEEVRTALEDAVRVRLASDVPLGALLSGGLDSSLVVALMSRAGVRPLRTFSIGFDEPEYDELRWARLVAQRYETEHHELVVRPDATELLPRLARHFDEPFADSSALPTFLLAEMARREVTVALGGDGGDELFGGYDRYAAVALAAAMDRMPRPAVDVALRMGTAMRGAPAGRGPSGPRSRATRLGRFLAALRLEPRRRYAAWVALSDEARKRELCEPSFAEAAGARDPIERLIAVYDRSDAPTFVEATQHVDLETYLPDDLLVKVDRASMAHGLEVRSPLLDHRVVELALRLPAEVKLRGRVGKRVLKRLARGVVPDAIVHRRKAGFGVPIDRWLRGELREMASDLLLSPRALGRGWCRPQAVRAMLDDHVAGRSLEHHRLWGLLMLELWYREFVDA
jgi:asparagine synthase (glutamine-hydrolysing)